MIWNNFVSSGISFAGKRFLRDLLSKELNALCKQSQNENEKLIFFYKPSSNLQKTSIKFNRYAFGEIASAVLYLALQNPLEFVLYDNVILKKYYVTKDDPNRKKSIDKQIKAINKLVFDYSSLEKFLEKVKIGVKCFAYRINSKYASKIKLEPRESFNTFR